MGYGLEERRIVIAGTKKTEEMSSLIMKQGGVALVRSLQGSLNLSDKEIAKDLNHIIESGADWIIFTTGVGIKTMLQQAEQLGLRDALMDIIASSKIAARGYKTFATLKEIGVAPIVVDDDGTLESLIRNLDSFNFENQGIVVQMHGEPTFELNRFLEMKGGIVRPVLPYRHVPPESDVVDLLCKELKEASVDAVCFTTEVQVRNLFLHVLQNDCLSSIQQAFRERVIAASVGKVTSKALLQAGVDRIIAPEHERMGAMIVELTRYYLSR